MYNWDIIQFTGPNAGSLLASLYYISLFYKYIFNQINRKKY